MTQLYYPSKFIMFDYFESDRFLTRVAYYRFRSEKSHLFYIVRVEEYTDHVYGVKFFLKQMLNSTKKYSHITNTFEPRTIIFSVLHLMLDILKKDSFATFMFVGNPDEGASHENTRRYRFYSDIVANTISEEKFKHILLDKYSVYILANKKQLAEDPFFADKLLENLLARFIIDDEPEHDESKF